MLCFSSLNNSFFWLKTDQKMMIVKVMICLIGVRAEMCYSFCQDDDDDDVFLLPNKESNAKVFFAFSVSFRLHLTRDVSQNCRSRTEYLAQVSNVNFVGCYVSSGGPLYTFHGEFAPFTNPPQKGKKNLALLTQPHVITWKNLPESDVHI